MTCPNHFQGKPSDSPVVAEFREDIEQFRCWILESELLALRRHDEYLRGELGLVLLKQASHEAI